MICKYFGIIWISKDEKLALQETQVDEVEIPEFVPDEAPDRINIRCDPFFDDIKVKVGFSIIKSLFHQTPNFLS